MLDLTQRQSLLAAVIANPTASAYRTAGDGYSLKEWCNTASAVSVWRTDAQVSSIIDAISWANYTPNDAADNTATYTNRALLAQTKQINLQMMLQGRQTIDASKSNIRAGLRDAVIQLPTGAGGQMTTAGGAGGVTVLNACTRLANNAEAVLAAPAQKTGTVSAQILTFEGSVDDSDVSWLINN